MVSNSNVFDFTKWVELPHLPDWQINRNFFKFSMPAILFFVFGLGRILFSVYDGQNIWLAFMRFLVVVAWAYGLNWLAEKGYPGVAWGILLLPVAIMLTLFG
jgi:hypothetical protein